MKKQKFTFKQSERSSRWSSFYPLSSEIKLNKFKVGWINEREPFDIWLTVMKKDINEDGNPNCKHRNIKLAKESASLKEAKEFLNNNIEAILSKYTLKSE